MWQNPTVMPMSTETLLVPSSNPAFPAAAVEAKLRERLIDLVDGTASMTGITLSNDLAAKCKAVIQIDSLDVVDVLCAVERVVGHELKDSIVRAGGYQSIEEALGHVMPRIEKSWNKHQEKGSK
jgi:hypothetical protein